MKQEIIIFMVIRNVEAREKLFRQVVEQASKISKNFFIVNHGSSDNTILVLNSIEAQLGINITRFDEEFQGTMDEMKGKYYKILKKKHTGDKNKYIFILDWDELLDNNLIDEIRNIDFLRDVYFINRHTYLINEPIDRNSYLPLLFQVDSVEIAAFETFHKLYKVNSKNTQKLKGILHHYSYTSMDDLFYKNKFYAKGEAENLFSLKNNISNISIFFRFLWEGTIYFSYSFIYHFNFLTLEGFLYSFNWYVYKFYKYIYYLELKNEK